MSGQVSEWRTTTETFVSHSRGCCRTEKRKKKIILVLVDTLETERISSNFCTAV